MKNVWNIEGAMQICKAIEEVAPQFGCHVALTGGCLYKPGLRKDVDILFYRIWDVAAIDVRGLFSALQKLGINRVEMKDGRADKQQSRATAGEPVDSATEDQSEYLGIWCVKAEILGAPIDFFFPEGCDPAELAGETSAAQLGGKESSPRVASSD